jgi:hypothetical protein
MTLQSFDAEQFDQSRQFLLDRRTERLHPKRHRTQKRAKRIGAKKRARVKHRNAVTLMAKLRFNAAVRAYWLGEVEAHP